MALRTGIFQRLASFLFYWPLAIIGFSPELILPVVALNLILQFLPHTRVIPKLPAFIDSWLNTPYHHRIHHAANRIYWDKNYGGTFIIWDRLFGSFQKETETPFYGITVHPSSWDPTWLNFHWFIVLWNDMMNATSFIDKIKIWFMPPGWRPRNLPKQYVENKTEKTAANQIKYEPKPLKGSYPYLIFQLIINMGLLFVIISNKSPLNNIEKFLLSLIIWFSVTTWAHILESRKYVKYYEYVKHVISSLLLWSILKNYTTLDSFYLFLIFGPSIVSIIYLKYFVSNPDEDSIKYNFKLRQGSSA